MEDTKNLPILILTLTMPFIAAFHTSLGAPWMLASVSTLIVCAVIIGISNGMLNETDAKSEPLESSQTSDKKLSEPLFQDQS